MLGPLGCHCLIFPIDLMPRLTITLSDEEHQALKLLTLMERKKLVAVVQEAIHSHLVAKGAFNLEVKPRNGE